MYWLWTVMAASTAGARMNSVSLASEEKGGAGIVESGLRIDRYRH